MPELQDFAFSNSKLMEGTTWPSELKVREIVEDGVPGGDLGVVVKEGFPDVLQIVGVACDSDETLSACKQGCNGGSCKRSGCLPARKMPWTGIISVDGLWQPSRSIRHIVLDYYFRHNIAFEVEDARDRGRRHPRWCSRLRVSHEMGTRPCRHASRGATTDHAGDAAARKMSLAGMRSVHGLWQIILEQMQTHGVLFLASKVLGL